MGQARLTCPKRNGKAVERLDNCGGWLEGVLPRRW
jgi:hypothetical protein